MQILDRFIFTSDYPIDKIAWVKEDVITLDNRGKATIEYNTGLSKTVFAEGVGSFDDWETSAPIIRTRSDGAVDGIVECEPGIVAIVITPVGSNPSYANKTLKVRLWGYMNENDAKTTDLNRNAAIVKNALSFNSDNNYPRFVAEGIIKHGETYTHNLGFIPTVLYWERVYADDEVWDYRQNGEYDKDRTIGSSFYATKNTLSFGEGGGQSEYYFRIYAQ